MTTALDVVSSALRKSGVLGVGQTANAEDSNDAFSDLNDMLAQWQRKRWLVYHLADVAFTSTGAQSYTVGPTSNFVVAARPDKLEAAFLRMLNSSQQPDVPLRIITAHEDYNRIAIKTQGTYPNVVFYDPAYPVGLLYPWPVPASGLYELHITIKETLGALANLAATINLPPEYIPALKFNLAVRINASYPGSDPIPDVVALAKDSLNTIRLANGAVPEMRMPSGLTARMGRYNVYTDYPTNQ